MGMQQIFADGVSAIFSAMGDIVQSVTYTSRTETYDAASRVSTLTTASYAISAILDEYGAVELRFSERLNDDMAIRPTDKKCMIKASELSSLTPKPLDTITISSVAWQIKSIKIDPASAMYVFQIRKP